MMAVCELVLGLICFWWNGWIDEIVVELNE